jgi:hypothetical protein
MKKSKVIAGSGMNSTQYAGARIRARKVGSERLVGSDKECVLCGKVMLPGDLCYHVTSYMGQDAGDWCIECAGD